MSPGRFLRPKAFDPDRPAFNRRCTADIRRRARHSAGGPKTIGRPARLIHRVNTLCAL